MKNLYAFSKVIANASCNKFLNCPQTISKIFSVTTNIKLNPDQQQALELLEKNCKKVELYVNDDDQKEARCLLEDQKVIDVTFYSESELCVTFWHKDCDAENQESMLNHKLDEHFINRMFETVANDTQERLEHVCNKTYAQSVRDFLK